MDIKDLLPLVGVFVGWILKELSDSFKERGQNRKEIGRALVGLLQLNDELRRLKSYQEYYKDRAGSWEKYERFRVRTSKRYLARTDPAKSVQTAIEVLGSRSPTDAVNLRDLSLMLAYYQNLTLEAASKDDDSYVKMLSALEVAFDVSEFSLKKFILKLAWLQGFPTWLKVRISWLRSSSKLAQKNRRFTESLLDEVLMGGDGPKKTDNAPGSKDA